MRSLEEAERGIKRGKEKEKEKEWEKEEKGRTEVETGENLCDHRVGKYVLGMTPNAHYFVVV